MNRQFRITFSDRALEQLEGLARKSYDLSSSEPVPTEKLRDVVRATIAMYQSMMNAVLQDGVISIRNSKTGESYEMQFIPYEIQRALESYGARNFPDLGQKLKPKG